MRRVGFGRTFVVAYLAGIPTLLAFFVWHWYNIAPVWMVLVEGAVGIAVAAAGIAWAWRLSPFRGLRGGLAFGAIFAAGVLLGELIGLAHGPWPDPTSVSHALPILAFVMIPVALVALAGWRIAGHWRGALAYFAASLVPLVYLGGSVVQRGGAGLGLGLFVILLPGYLLAGTIVGTFAPAGGQAR